MQNVRRYLRLDSYMQSIATACRHEKATCLIGVWWGYGPLTLNYS